MPGLIFMLPIAIGIALVFLWFFLWSVRNGDYEDPEMPKYRMIYDEDSHDPVAPQPRPKEQKNRIPDESKP